MMQRTHVFCSGQKCTCDRNEGLEIKLKYTNKFSFICTQTIKKLIGSSFFRASNEAIVFQPQIHSFIFADAGLRIEQTIFLLILMVSC